MKANDVFETVTAKVVDMIENGTADGRWVMPWTLLAANRPHNVTTKKPYRGGNVWGFMAEQLIHGYSTGEWASYKQWAAKGAQVRKGEKGTWGVYWKPITKPSKLDPSKTESFLIPLAFNVFNADQVDGYEPKAPEAGLNEAERMADAEEFFKAVGAKINYGGDEAFYATVADEITMPAFAQFKDPTAFYGTLAHEHTHWTGHKDRLNRNLKNRFGNDAYAAEELVAELGAAFVLAELGITSEPREDHAQYLAHWLKVLKADPKALFTASSAAQKAADFLAQAARRMEAPAEKELVSA